MITLLAEVHLETLHQLTRLPAGTRVGVVSADRKGSQPGALDRQTRPCRRRAGGRPQVEGTALRRLGAAGKHDGLFHGARRECGPGRPPVPVIVDDRALNQRAIQMLRTIWAKRTATTRSPPPPPSSGAARSACRPGVPRWVAFWGDGDGAGRRRRAMTR